MWKIDFSDISESSPEQLTAMRRVGRLPIGDEARRLIAIRIDANVLSEFRREARRRGIGRETLINEVLAGHVEKGVAVGTDAQESPRQRTYRRSSASTEETNEKRSRTRRRR